MNKDNIKEEIKRKLEEITDKTLLKIIKQKGLDPNRVWTTNDRKRIKLYIAKHMSIEQIAIRMNRGYFFIKNKVYKDLKYSYEEIDSLEAILKDTEIIVK